MKPANKHAWTTKKKKTRNITPDIYVCTLSPHDILFLFVKLKRLSQFLYFLYSLSDNYKNV